MISGPETSAPVGPVTAEERLARIGHRPYLILLPNADADVASEVERNLFDHGYLVYCTGNFGDGTAAARAGMISLVYGPISAGEVYPGEIPTISSTADTVVTILSVLRTVDIGR